MIILDEREFIRNEFEAKGFEIFDFYDEAKVLDLKSFLELELKRRAEFLVVDTQTLLNHPEKHEHFKSILNTFHGAIFIHDQSNHMAQEWVKNEGAFLTKIIGEYSLPMAQLGWTILSNQLQFIWRLIEDQRNLQKQMMSFSLDLDQVIQNAELEMIKAKKIHDALVPRRNEEIRGVKFLNKYAVGDGGGGEFYDLHQTPQKVFQVIVSSQSYLVSSAVLGILGKMREKEFNPEVFITDAYGEADAINGVKKNKLSLDLLVLELDLTSLVLKAWTDSKAELCTPVKGRISLQKDMTYQMEKGEKVIVFSPGFIFNWRESHPEKEISTFMKEMGRKDSDELISECLFHLKNGKETQIFKKDATVVVMEVKRHGFHKV